MCFSLFQVPRYRIYTVTSSWWERYHNLSRTGGNSCRFSILGSSSFGPEGHSRRWSRRPVTEKMTGRNKSTLSSKTNSVRHEISDGRRPVTTKTEGRNKNTLSSETSSVRHEISDGTISVGTNLNVKESEVNEVERIQCCEIQQKISENRDLAKDAIVIVFDCETTGFSKEDRIIEIALRDLSGGENSTFQTLVNPERYVPNTHVHGISTQMVNRPDVPKMKDLIPVLLQYVRSRQKPGGHVLWIAHNARNFDIPFLVKEFSRCSYEVPADWLFVDTLPLAREVMKSRGSKVPSKISLQALREFYKIPEIGTVHRAMSDVHVLSLVLQGLTFDLKLPLSGLVERSFRASDLTKLKKNSS